MSEFANTLRENVAQAIRREFHQEPISETNSLLELIAMLIADEDGIIMLPPICEVTEAQWFTWNQLAMDREEELIQEIFRRAEEENLTLPSGLPAMRAWANSLVLSTLDELGMA